MRRQATLILTLAAAAALGAAPKIDQAAFSRFRSYQFGKDNRDKAYIADLAVQSLKDPALRKALEPQLIAILQDPKATTDSKRWVCRQLLMMGTRASIPALAALLPDKNLSHMARYALERMEYPEAGKALRDALTRAKGRPLVGIVNSLGERRDTQATAALAKLLGSSDPELALAAARALGKTGGDEALAALQRARPAAKGKLKAIVTDAIIRCAEGFLAAGQREKARAIYERLYAPGESPQVRAAALRGLVAVGGPKALDLVISQLMGKDPNLRAAAISFVRDVPGTEATKAFAASLPRLPAETQAMVIAALATRGDKAATPAVLRAVSNADQRVRLAALRALARLGDASCVPLLVKTLAKGAQPEADTAFATLTILPGEKADKAIVASLAEAPAAARPRLIRAILARRPKGAVGILLKYVDDPDPAVAKEAFNAVGKLATADDLPILIDRMVDARDPAALRSAERAVIAVARTVGDEGRRTEALMAGYEKARGQAKASLLRILGRFGGPKALAAARAALASTDQALREAALRTLAEWPDPSPADDLLKIVKTASSPVHRILALRGYVRMLAMPSNEPIGEILRRYDEIMKLAPRPEDKKLVLASMAELRHPAVLKALEPFTRDPALAAEAKAASAKVKKAMKQPARLTASHNPGKARNAMDGNPGTRWDTGAPQRGGEWFLIELPLEQEIAGLVLDTSGSRGDYPRGYEVYVSRDGKNWGKPVATGRGTKPVTEIKFKPTFGRFIKIVQTGKVGRLFWSIHELKILSKPLAEK